MSTTYDIELAVWEQRQSRIPTHHRDGWFFRRRAAQHEAAHVVAAWGHDIFVSEASIDDTGGGQCVIPHSHYAPHSLRAHLLAGDLWIREYADPWYADDYMPSKVDAQLVANLGGQPWQTQQAAARCRTIFNGWGGELVPTLAARLLAEGTIRWKYPEPSRLPRWEWDGLRATRPRT